MIQAAGLRKLLMRPGSADTSPQIIRKTTALRNSQKELALYCQAHPGESRRFMGGQTAHDILVHGFQNRRYRFHAPSNDWIAPSEWIERNGIFLADRPSDPSGTASVQIEVVLTLTEEERSKYEMVRSEPTGLDYTGMPYRRNREFLIPAILLNKRAQVRILPPEDAYAMCAFRIAEAEERARQREAQEPQRREPQRQDRAA